MKIDAGRAITEAMERQRERDIIRLVSQEFIETWGRMARKLRDKGWISSQPEPTTFDDVMEQCDIAVEEVTKLRDDSPWRRPE